MKNGAPVLWMALFALLAIAQSPAPAGERIESQSTHINVVSRFDTLRVDDDQGRFIAIIRASGAGRRVEGPEEPPYTIEIWGTGDYKNDGTGDEHGYGKFTFADGSSYFEEWTSKAAGGKGVGTAVYYGGTGRFKGMTGGSSFDCTALGDRFSCDVKGWIELP
ncbi:MAG: hypothetical protein CME26_15140 [Gemmatimonadetes bacterium]|nr:hypothetical protein [Gemmatimonadota bacterium]|tara:strand:- start:3367 stop:3855 length:489 start_codon:yes stop_codon:yes gene_type:complete